jgi:signal transduction histidine kinase
MACVSSIDGWEPRRDAGSSLVASLSEVAARVQRGRTAEDVLRIAGEGVAALGMRFLVLQCADEAFVLRALFTAPTRLLAVERKLGRSVHGLRAPVSRCASLRELVDARRTTYCDHIDVFDRFVLAATGQVLDALESTSSTAGVANGVLAPLFVHERPWGLLSLVSPHLTPDDAAAARLFTSQVGSALEAAETIDALETKNRELSSVNAELSVANAELVKRERLAAVGELAAIVAHEVRNPLCVIFNALTSLRREVDRDAPSSTRDELLDILGDEAHRLNYIVAQMLDLAKPSALRIQQTRLSELLHGVVSAAEASPDAAGVSFRVEVAPDEPDVDMDPRFMHQALLNLVLNAMHASPRGADVVLSGEVAVSAGRPVVRLCVVDTGPGIPVEDRDRIFEPLFTTKSSGTGLGLSLVKRVVEAHAGEITCSTDASGSVFVIAFPAMAGAASPRERESGLLVAT